jgi:hypothetical protein
LVAAGSTNPSLVLPLHSLLVESELPYRKGEEIVSRRLTDRLASLQWGWHIT